MTLEHTKNKEAIFSTDSHMTSPIHCMKLQACFLSRSIKMHFGAPRLSSKETGKKPACSARQLQAHNQRHQRYLLFQRQCSQKKDARKAIISAWISPLFSQVGKNYKRNTKEDGCSTPFLFISAVQLSYRVDTNRFFFFSALRNPLLHVSLEGKKLN